MSGVDLIAKTSKFLLFLAFVVSCKRDASEIGVVYDHIDIECLKTESQSMTTFSSSGHVGFGSVDQCVHAECIRRVMKSAAYSWQDETIIKEIVDMRLCLK